MSAKIVTGVDAEFRCPGVQELKFAMGPAAIEGDTFVVPRPVNSHSLPASLKISNGGHFSFDGYGAQHLIHRRVPG
ncbi:MAG: hypothetical protein ABI355_01880 [Solirubrobacteraceae bacterium]